MIMMSPFSVAKEFYLMLRLDEGMQDNHRVVETAELNLSQPYGQCWTLQHGHSVCLCEDSGFISINLLFLVPIKTIWRPWAGTLERRAGTSTEFRRICPFWARLVDVTAPPSSLLWREELQEVHTWISLSFCFKDACCSCDAAFPWGLFPQKKYVWPTWSKKNEREEKCMMSPRVAERTWSHGMASLHC